MKTWTTQELLDQAARAEDLITSSRPTDRKMELHMDMMCLVDEIVAAADGQEESRLKKQLRMAIVRCQMAARW